MFLRVYEDSGKINSYEIKKELFFDESLANSYMYINSPSKETDILNIFKGHFSGAKLVLFDSQSKQLSQKVEQILSDGLESFRYLFFTSGTSGEPSGAYKTEQNIFSEIEAQTKLLCEFNIKKVVMCVPYIHIYGFLMGFAYALYNDIDIELKEHFLPNDLLDFSTPNTLVVTTPLYIKALNRLSDSKDLSKTIFLSSTSPLFCEDAKIFADKYNTTLIQIFGSTETGGVAYRVNEQSLWSAYEGVKLSTNEQNELKITSPFVSRFVYEKSLKDIDQTIQTSDFVRIENDKFELIGRSSQMVKLAGKRYSTVQIENILEKIDGINCAHVSVKKAEDELKDEKLVIHLEAVREFSKKEILKVLKDELTNLKFNIELLHVKSIKKTSLGKKYIDQSAP